MHLGPPFLHGTLGKVGQAPRHHKQILSNGQVIDLGMIHGLELLLLVEFGQHLERIGRGGQNVQSALGLLHHPILGIVVHASELFLRLRPPASGGRLGLEVADLLLPTVLLGQNLGFDLRLVHGVLGIVGGSGYRRRLLERL